MLGGLIFVGNSVYSMKRSVEESQPEMDRIDGVFLLVAGQEYNNIVKQADKNEWKRAQKFICNHDFGKKNHTEPKIKKAKEVITYNCDNGVCRFFTTHEVRMRNHQRMHVIKDTNFGKMYQCEWCDYLTNVQGTFQDHKGIHQGIKKYHCNTCKQSFSTWRSQRRHEIQQDHQQKDVINVL